MKGPDPRPSRAAGGVRAPDRAESNGAVQTAPPPPRDQPPRNSGKNPLKRSTKIGLAIVAIVALAEAAAFGGRYFLHTSHYVSTSNAEIDGDKVNINAPISGTLTRWSIHAGSVVGPDQVIGRIEPPGAGQVQQPIKSPGRGRVAVSYGVNGQYVTAGTQLATAYDFDNIYVTARVDENDISDVHLGQPVDISVDAFPQVPVTGVVVEIQASSAGSFNIFPGPETDPTNPQKVIQYLPVKIALTNTDGAPLLPGMSVTVHIAKR